MHAPRKFQSCCSSSLPPGCALPRLKSLFIDQATRGAGKTLYEMLGMAELMRVAYEKGELKSVQERLSLLLSNAAGLSLTLSNILELEQLGTAGVETKLEEFDVVALLHEVAQAARAFLGEKPVRIMDVASPGPLQVLSDPWKVRQIMTELAINAAKFTSRGRIALIVNKDANSLRLIVTDTGRGMSPEQIAAYFPVDDRSFDGLASDDGHGLGLRIVGHVVKSLDGRITVSSKIDEGTIVEVLLPLIHTSSPRNMNREERLIEV